MDDRRGARFLPRSRGVFQERAPTSDQRVAHASEAASCRCRPSADTRVRGVFERGQARTSLDPHARSARGGEPLTQSYRWCCIDGASPCHRGPLRASWRTARGWGLSATMLRRRSNVLAIGRWLDRLRRVDPVRCRFECSPHRWSTAGQHDLWATERSQLRSARARESRGDRAARRGVASHASDRFAEGKQRPRPMAWVTCRAGGRARLRRGS
jgi:hypothetical protein